MPDDPSKSDLYQLLAVIRGDVKAVQEALKGNSDPSALLTRNEAADRLRISTRTLDDMADAGEIQPVRIRGRVLYHPETVEAYIQRRVGEDRK